MFGRVRDLCTREESREKIRVVYVLGRIKRGVPMRKFDRSSMVRSYFEKRELFKAGIKPALMLPYKRDVVDLLKVYPYVDMGQDLYILFQNDDLKNRFEVERAIAESGVGSMALVLGESLGYPPCAVRAYVERELTIASRAKVTYYGMTFVCLVEDVPEALTWLAERYVIPESMKREFLYEIREGE